jgi:Flp pilus assembly protein TadG
MGLAAPSTRREGAEGVSMRLGGLGDVEHRSDARPRWARDERGQSLVEFALVVPVLMLIIIGIFEFGKTYNDWLRLTDAVRVSGRAAATQLPDSDGRVTGACQAGQDAFQLSSPPAEYTCVPATVNGDQGVTIKGRYPYSINVFGLSVFSGSLSSQSTERLA